MVRVARMLCADGARSVDASQRLGSTHHGVDGIKKHPFFAAVNW
jgi:hypothetical protein